MFYAKVSYWQCPPASKHTFIEHAAKADFFFPRARCDARARVLG